MVYYWLYYIDKKKDQFSVEDQTDPELRSLRFVEVPPSRGWRVPWDAECVDGLLIVWEPGCHGHGG